MKMMHKHRYINGNMLVTIDDRDGTRSCFSFCNEFKPKFSLNIDVTISRKCDYGCKFCYLGCTKDGGVTDFNYKFIDTLHPYTELALNINSEIPDGFYEFLNKLKNKKIFVNLTVNQKFFMDNYEKLKIMMKRKWIYGLGISLVNPTDDFIYNVKKFPNAVIHTINGILTYDQIMKLADNDLKILILGYKTKERGSEYLDANENTIKRNMKVLYNILPAIIDRFKLISLDCLGMEQLNPKRFISPKEFNRLYQGDDGTITFAIDMVNGTFSPSSTSEQTWSIMDSVEDMFACVLNRCDYEKNKKERT